MDSGALPLFVQMMKYEEDAEEQFAAARAIWALAFEDQIKPRIMEEPECMATLELLKENGQGGRVRRAAEGAIWIIKDTANDIRRNSGKPSLIYLYIVCHIYLNLSN